MATIFVVNAVVDGVPAKDRFDGKNITWADGKPRFAKRAPCARTGLRIRYYGDVLQQKYYGKYITAHMCITADILWEIYQGRYIATDILWHIYYSR